MIALWMGYSAALTLLLGLAALALDSLAGRWGGRRRWIWSAALAGAIALPAWQGVRPRHQPPPQRTAAAAGDRIVAPARTAGVTPIGASLADLLERARPEARALARLDTPLAALWFAGAGVLLLFYATAVALLGRARRRWRESTVDGQSVLIAPSSGPAVVGALRPRIVLPEWSLGLPAAERALMLTHEREHVRARDPLLLHAAMVVVLSMPWNVAAWWLLRRLRLAVELDCDARVLGAGRDARTYGTLLLNVCARRARGVPFLAPALLERTSSLSRRILAMHPRHQRFMRARATLGCAAAFALVALACEAPSPEVLAPDGRDVAAQRLYGSSPTSTTSSSTDVRALIGRYFPEVARGEGGPAMLIFVRNADGEIVMTERGPNDGRLLRTPRRAEREESAVTSQAIEAGANRLGEARTTGTVRLRALEPRTEGGAQAGALAPTRTSAVGERSVARVGGAPPSDGIAMLAPDEIESVEVVKHSAGKLAPNALSIIWIDLKPGARVPGVAAAR